jgi:hypothetical protein
LGERAVLHIATTGVSWTARDDEGESWHQLNIPGTTYYPRSVQAGYGTIHVFEHIGGDNSYGSVDQAIVMDSFRLVAKERPPKEQSTTRFSEHLIADKYAYTYGIAAADFDRDGDLDLSSVDYTPHNMLYLFENDSRGNFKRHSIQKDYSERLERHMIGDVDGDGDLDIVIVKNLRGHLLWFENNGKPTDEKLWRRHVIMTKLPEPTTSRWPISTRTATWTWQHQAGSWEINLPGSRTMARLRKTNGRNASLKRMLPKHARCVRQTSTETAMPTCWERCGRPVRSFGREPSFSGQCLLDKTPHR